MQTKPLMNPNGRLGRRKGMWLAFILDQERLYSHAWLISTHFQVRFAMAYKATAFTSRQPV